MIVKAKYLNNNSNFLFKTKKSSSASKAWKNIFDQQDLHKRGIAWILGNGKSIYFWYDMWMTLSPLINNVNLYKEVYVNKDEKVSDCIKIGSFIF